MFCCPSISLSVFSPSRCVFPTAVQPCRFTRDPVIAPGRLLSHRDTLKVVLGGCRCRDQPRPDKIQIHSCTTLSKPISSPTRDTHTRPSTHHNTQFQLLSQCGEGEDSPHTHTYTHTRSLSNPIQSCVVMDLPGVMSGQRWFTVVWTGTKTRPLMFSQPNTTHRFTILAVPLLNMHTVLFFQTATKLSTRLSALNKCTGCT